MAQQTEEPVRSPTPEQLAAETRTTLAKIAVAGVGVFLVGLAVFVLAAVPLANAVAGQQTDFSFTASFSVNIALAATASVTGAGCVVQSMRLKRHKEQVRELERRLVAKEEKPKKKQRSRVAGS
ncbi:hypothetical protein [Streptomyces sp. bgisy027]|uniref:hypothetical protein n=1 Tax=Streptomyces sp. bgisy027 TaxID=3413770 RepID=UPI003D70FF3A